MRVKFGRELWVFVSASDPSSARHETERETIWNDLDDCLPSLECM